MILTGEEIKKQYELGRIIIDPFDEKMIGPNSYDVHLDEILKMTKQCVLNMNEEPELITIPFPLAGAVIDPNTMYIGSIIEKIGSDYYVPDLSGRSTTGRFGVKVHNTAGWGDTGFINQWTLEISCVQPIRIYPGVRIAQVRFSTTMGEITKYAGHYANQEGPTGVKL